MSDYRRSYLKTIVATGTIAGGGIIALAGMAIVLWTSAAHWSWPSVSLLVGSILLVGLCSGFAALVTAGGLLSLHRDTLESRGIPYATRKPREWEPGAIVRIFRRAFRTILLAFSRTPGRLALRPGELVEVLPLEQILATLDDQGRLDLLPFMPEMSAFCGRQFQVFRRVEKIFDYVFHTGLRRSHDIVLLKGLRCDGGQHGGCQASCQLLWKEAWLKRVVQTSDATDSRDSHAPPHATPWPVASQADLVRLTQRNDQSGASRYVCQMTEVARGTSPLKWMNPWQYVRDLAFGNVRPGPFLEGIAIALFNWTQRRRGGAGFPSWVIPEGSTSQHQVLGLQQGELVRVRRKIEIAATLNSSNRNRGLWFDAEMIRHCGGEYRVAASVQRLIEENSGKLRTVTNPCIILDGVTATGEYIAFCPQNEAIFWREIWLERVEGRPALHPTDD